MTDEMHVSGGSVRCTRGGYVTNYCRFPGTCPCSVERSVQLDTRANIGGWVGKAKTNPSTLHMDGTSPVTVYVQATNEELRALHNQQVRIIVELDGTADMGGVSAEGTEQ